eukprot:Sspe_Gene.28745::Locus_13202_Transcript_1_5_Confidence_0.250_Length_1770::g.28745::m.28745
MGCGTSSQRKRSAGFGEGNSVEQEALEVVGVVEMQESSATQSPDPFQNIKGFPELLVSGSHSSMTIERKIKSKSIVRLLEISDRRGDEEKSDRNLIEEVDGRSVLLRRISSARNRAVKRLSQVNMDPMLETFQDEGGIGRKTTSPALLSMPSPDDGDDIELPLINVVRVESLLKAANQRGNINMKEFVSVVSSTLQATDDEEGEEVVDARPVLQPPSWRSKYPPFKRVIKNYSIVYHTGHSSRVKCLAAVEGCWYLSSDRADTMMHLFNQKTGGEMLTYVGHKNAIMSVAADPQRKYVATASRDCTLKLWDVVSGMQVHAFNHPGVVTAACFTPSGNHIVTGCQDNVVRQYGCKSGRLVLATKPSLMWTHGATGVISSLSLIDDHFVVVGSSDSCVRILSLGSGKRIQTLRGHSDMVWTVTVSPAGKMASSCDKHAKVWEVVKGKGSIVRTWSQADLPGLCSEYIITTCCFCPGEFAEHLCVAASNHTLYIGNIESGVIIMNIPTQGALYCLSPGSEDTIVTGDDCGNIAVITLD